MSYIQPVPTKQQMEAKRSAKTAAKKKAMTAALAEQATLRAALKETADTVQCLQAELRQLNDVVHDLTIHIKKSAAAKAQLAADEET